MDQQAPLERRETYYAGTVQGVGFRHTCRQLAARFRVTGYVQNLPDGRVLLVAEGAAGELDRFLGAVEVALAEHIRATTRTTLPAGGDFDQFGVRY
ncbi:MAG: acylphosphatase [Planctomycetaceae bacterium]|nr:acylphosphatase [Planctomycetaceae bacterium]